MKSVAQIIFDSHGANRHDAIDQHADDECTQIEETETTSIYTFKDGSRIETGRDFARVLP